MWPNPQETADLVTLTEETLHGRLHFLWNASPIFAWNSTNFQGDKSDEIFRQFLNEFKKTAEMFY